jgi:hypothetical protein
MPVPEEHIDTDTLEALTRTTFPGWDSLPLLLARIATVAASIEDHSGHILSVSVLFVPDNHDHPDSGEWTGQIVFTEPRD